MIELPINGALEVVRVRLTVCGIVQGVGFRPFVFRLAQSLGLMGHVFNAGDGVRIEVEGPAAVIETFAKAISADAPANARIDMIRRESLEPEWEAEFWILESEPAALPGLVVPPDLATCPSCVAELLNRNDRRHRYPLINCTACGPRFSILEALPYDRQRTTMRSFAMCSECGSEYQEPGDRRFHAEPIACPQCGPRMSFQNAAGEHLAKGDEAVQAAIRDLGAGQIVAVKGIGGYHLIADATSDTAVAKLRRRKQRPTKPLALMVPSIETAHALCHLSAADVAALRSPAAPIVLAERKADAPVSDLIAPDCGELGLMLPYTPVHHLLLHTLKRPLAVTSGNRAGEPLMFEDRSARRRLHAATDRFLMHNRRIRRPVEDSVLRTFNGAPQVLRLGRGFAPDVIALSRKLVPDGPTVLALGGNMKTAPVLMRGHEAILGPHTGDIESIAAEEMLGRALEDLQSLHGCRAEVLACDRHPDYPTTHLAETFGLPLVQVQHHAAHIASIIAEHGLTEPVLGIAWDGSGYGTDGTVWGGEGIWMTPDGWERVVRLRPFPLPGGEKAIREPRRALYGMLYEAGRTDLMAACRLRSDEKTSLRKLLEAGLNTPRTSSAGRLFDAAAAMLGLASVNRHEGEAAMRLEYRARLAAAAGTAPESYDFTLAQGGTATLPEIDWHPLICAMADDMARGVSVDVIALKLHETMAAIIAALARHFAAPCVALSGGCFQNRLLTERTVALLQADGVPVYLNRRVSPGDGGLALGQALIARRHLAAGG